MVASLYLIFEGSDIYNAYLHGDLYETVIMELPTDSTGISEKFNQVAKVNKSLYDHKSSVKIWVIFLQNSFISFGFLQSKQYQRLYFLNIGEEISRFRSRL